jgi:phytoene dehydrogenase-like protein
VKIPLLVIGGGLSGLAAAIRAARFIPDILILEKHSRLGGLNSYYFRNKILFETGLHAITNYAPPESKKAPINRLFRQLKLKRKDFAFCQQFGSEINFSNCGTLRFSNDIQLLETEINNLFPQSIDRFKKLVIYLDKIDPFVETPFRSAKKTLEGILENDLLTQMLLCPLMYYGSSHENDMDLNQFAIMFQAIYQQGMFRPEGTIKDFLDILSSHFADFGGKIRQNAEVSKILHNGNSVHGVQLISGEIIECDYILSTIGVDETRRLITEKQFPSRPRLAFTETIFRVKKDRQFLKKNNKTIIFYNESPTFRYQNPVDYVDHSSGVICFPSNFQGIKTDGEIEIRATHLASYDQWKKLADDQKGYREQKRLSSRQTLKLIENKIGNFSSDIVYEDTFTPVTIERYTSKIGGAIYGSPDKIKDGNIGFSNLFLAGTDQGFLGIIGSMLSGVSIVNRHILPKL